jgi:hypothetical protein
MHSRVEHRSATQKRCPGLGCAGGYAYHSNDEDEDEDDHRNDSDTINDQSDSDNDRAREEAMGREEIATQGIEVASNRR